MQHETNDKKKQKTRVKVAVRVRPMIPRQIANNDNSCVEFHSDKQIVLGINKNYNYDHVFKPTSRQQQIYDACVKDLVLKCFEGYNSAILAYGQTGSGKTHTMGTSANYVRSTDSNSEAGIIPRVIEHIFQLVQSKKDKTSFKVKASFLEIYNQEIKDLLLTEHGMKSSSTAHKSNSNRDSTSGISIREQKDGSVSIYGITQEESSTPEQMAALLERGGYNRTTACTLMNDSSSRSHAIFTIFIEQQAIEQQSQQGNTSGNSNNNSNQGYMTAKFFFVDLAGSERAKKTGATGATLKEGININMGLLQLGNVISALSAIQKRQDQFISYRNSKLTRILQDCLGGNSNTYMIACISPAQSNFDESLNTLKYASKAMNIKNKPIVNRDPQTAMIAQLKQKVYDLQTENKRIGAVLCKELGITMKEAQQKVVQMYGSGSGQDKVGTSLSTTITNQTNSTNMHGISFKNDMSNNNLSLQNSNEQQQQLFGLKKALITLQRKYDSVQQELNKNKRNLNQLEIKSYQILRERDAYKVIIEQVQTEHPEMEDKLNEKLNSHFMDEDQQGKNEEKGLAIEQAAEQSRNDQNQNQISQKKQSSGEQQGPSKVKDKSNTRSVKFSSNISNLVEKYQKEKLQLEQSLQQKDALYERLENEYAKLQMQSRNDEKILIKKNKQIYMLTKKMEELEADKAGQRTDQKGTRAIGDNNTGNQQKGSRKESINNDEDNNDSSGYFEDDDYDNGVQIDSDGEVIISNSDQREQHAEQLRDLEEEFVDIDDKSSKKQAQVRQIEKYIRDKEEYLQKITQNQIAMEYELISEMKEEYHSKIQLLEKEKKHLIKQKDQTISSSEKTKFVSTIDNLEKELKSFRKKLKEQKSMETQLTIQNQQVKKLADQIKSVKLQKKQATRKLKQDKQAFLREKAIRVKEILRAKRDNARKDAQIKKIKLESQRNDIKTRKKDQEINKYKRVNQTLKNLMKQSGNSAKPLYGMGRGALSRKTTGDQQTAKGNSNVNAIQRLSQTPSQGSMNNIPTSNSASISPTASNLTQVIDPMKLSHRIKAILRQITLTIERQKTLQRYSSRLSQLETQYNELLDQQATLRIRQQRINYVDVVERTEDQIRDYEQAEIELADVRERLMNGEDSMKFIKVKQEELIGQEIASSSMKLIKTSNDGDNQKEEGNENKQSFTHPMFILQTQILYNRQYTHNVDNVRTLYELLFQALHDLLKDNYDLIQSKQQSLIIQSNLQKLLQQTQQSFSQAKQQYRSELSKLRHQMNIQCYNNSYGAEHEHGEHEQQYNPNSYKKMDEKQRKALERKVADMAKSNRQLTQQVEIWKRKCSVVQDKYVNMKNIMCKDKNIGRGGINTNSSNVGCGDEGYSNNAQDGPLLMKKSSHRAVLNDVQDIINECDRIGAGSGFNKKSSMHQHQRQKSMSHQQQNSFQYCQKVDRNSAQRERGQQNSGEKYRQQQLENNEGSGSFFSNQDENSNNDNGIVDYSSNKWQCMSKLQAHNSSVLSIAAHANILISTATKSLKIWDLQTSKVISDLSGPHLSGLVKFVLVDPERRLMFTACDKNITIWDLVTLNVEGTLKAHKDEVRTLHICNDLLFSGGKGQNSQTGQSAQSTHGSLLAWDLRNLNPNVPMQEKQKNQDIFTFASHGRTLYYGTRNHHVRRLNTQSMDILPPFEPPHMDSVTGLAVLGEDRLVSVSKDKNIKLWALGAGQQGAKGSGSSSSGLSPCKHTFPAFHDYITTCQRAGSSDQLNHNTLPIFYAGSRDGQVKMGGIVNKNGKRDKIQLMGGILAHTQSVNGICSLTEENNNMIVTASADKTVKIWKPTAQTVQSVFK